MSILLDGHKVPYDKDVLNYLLFTPIYSALLNTTNQAVSQWIVCLNYMTCVVIRSVFDTDYFISRYIVFFRPFFC